MLLVTTRWRRRAVDAVPLLILLGFALAVLAPSWGGRIPVATDSLSLWGPGSIVTPQAVHNTVLADSAMIYLPWQVADRRSLAQGEWPLWNPDLFAGYPFQGNPQTQLYYPVTWLLWGLPLPAAILLNRLLHLWLAGAGMYVLLRAWGSSRSAALVAGLAFAGSWVLYTQIELDGILAVYPWLPWVLAAVEQAWQRRSWAWTAGASGLLGVLTLAGHLQYVFYSVAFLSLWLLARLGVAAFALRREERAARRAWGSQAARAGAILGGGLALSLPQTLPFLELALHSTRTSAGLSITSPTWDVLRYVLLQQLTLFAPLSWGTSDINHGALPPCFYLGLAPLLLALTALCVCRGRRILFLAGAALTAWGVAANVPYVNLLHQLPGLQAQLPYRVGYLFIFCTACLSAFGLDAWLGLARRRPAVAAGWIGTLLLLALLIVRLLGDHHAHDADNPALYALQAQGFDQAARVAGVLLAWAGAVVLLRGDRRPQTRLLLTGLLIALTGWDLLTYEPDFNTYVDPATLRPHSPTADLIRRDPTGSRVMAPDIQGPNFVPNSAILYGLHDVQGYDSLHLTRYEAYWAAADPTIHGNGYFDVFLRPQNFVSAQADLLNVKYVVTGAPLDRVEQTHAERTISELAYGPITQTFRTPDRLERLTVAFDTLDRVNHAPVTLHLRRALTDTTDLVTQTLSPQGWSGQPWIKFKFAPLAVHFGEPLTLILDSPGGRVGDTVAPRISVGDAYAYGTAYRRNPAIQRDFDLAFIAEGSVPAKLQAGFVGDTHVYTNTAALPRAFVVSNAAVLPADTIPARIAQPGFDPLRAVLLEQPPPPGFPQVTDKAASSPSPATPPAGTATITRYRNLSVDVTAQLTQPGWLVLGDVDYPGWAVTVDGQPAPLYTAYYILRAVPLPAGTHQVHFYFLPLPVLLGGAISGSTLLLILGVLYRAYWRRRTQRRGQAVSPTSPKPVSAVITAPQAKEAGR